MRWKRWVAGTTIVLLTGLFTARYWLEPLVLWGYGLTLHVPYYSYAGLEPGEEFRRISKEIKETDNAFHGRAQVRALESKLEASSLELPERVKAQATLAMEYTRLGDLPKANEIYATALAGAETKGAPAELLPFVLRNGIIVKMRTAEQQNCVQGHCAQSCLFPIERGGVHKRREAALEARSTIERYLALDPPDAHGMSWLLNIVNMTLGEYPDQVPEKYRLAPELFASTNNVGRFPDIATELGLHHLSLAGSAAAEDLDGDGILDMVCCCADPDEPLRLYRWGSQKKYENIGASAGLGDQFGGLHCQFVDYDNDGQMDIFVPRGAWFRLQGRIRNSLLRNRGDNTFVDVTRAAGLAEPPYPTQASIWADFDNDGDLDVFVGNESFFDAIPVNRVRFPSQFFRNNGDGTFTEISKESGIVVDSWVKGGAAGDYDNDGDMDLYVSSFWVNNPAAGRNFLFRNDGGLKFTEVAESLGVTEPGRSFASWFFDYNNDGWLDLFVASFSIAFDGDKLTAVVSDYTGQTHDADVPRLYRNDQGKGFTDVAKEVGMAHPYYIMGTSFGDIDHDGWLDMYLGTGAPEFEALVPNIMLRNNGGKTFEDITTSGGFGHLQKGHGIIFADYDNDGDQDVYADLGGFYPGDKFTKAFFLNPGHGNHYLYVKLVGTKTNKNAIGARIRVDVDTPDGPRSIYRAPGCVSSFGNHPTRMEIGLGNATAIRKVEIWWPTSGERQEFTDLPLDSSVRITEGSPEVEKLSLVKLPFDQLRRADELSER